MKAKIHPKTFETEISCACGQKFTSNACVEKMRVDICSKCHPFFTGKQKFVDTAGRVEKFQNKYGKDSRPQPKPKKKIERVSKDQKVEAQVAENTEPVTEEASK